MSCPSRYRSGSLRPLVGDPSPGSIVVRVRQPVLLKHHHACEITTVGTGSVVFVEATTNLSLALSLHLCGSPHDSELRFGLAILLGYGDTFDRGLSLSAAQNDAIDTWIDQHTVFEVFHRSFEEPPSVLGFLNGIREVWLDHQMSASERRSN